MAQCLSYLTARKIGRLLSDEAAGADRLYLETTAEFLVATARTPVIECDHQIVGQHLRLSSNPVPPRTSVLVVWSFIPAHHELVIPPE